MVTVLSACQIPRQTDVFALIDNNRDGQLSLVEVESYGFRQMFKRFDENKDSAITPDDLGGNAPNLMRKRDLNRDGKITYEEYAAGGHRQGTVKKLFISADTDGNGLISRKETEAYLSAGGGAILGN